MERHLSMTVLDFLPVMGAARRRAWWDAESLFGYRFERPIEYLGSAGLLWNVAGGEIVQLYRTGAAIMAGNGKQHIFNRRPSRMEIRLPWDLPQSRTSEIT
jgi:hypothetical protein